MAKESEKKKAQNLKNLKPHKFKKGQSGNLKGAPKGKRLSTILKDLVDTEIEFNNFFTKKKENKTLAEWVCIELLVTALFGEKTKGKALSMVFERLEGKVPDNLTIHTDNADLESIKNQIRISNKSAKKDEKES